MLNFGKQSEIQKKNDFLVEKIRTYEIVCINEK